MRHDRFDLVTLSKKGAKVIRAIHSFIKSERWNLLFFCTKTSDLHEKAKELIPNPALIHKNVLLALKKKKGRREGKGRRCCCGAESINFFAELAILRQDFLNNRINFIRTIWKLGWIAPGRYEFIPFFKSFWWKIAIAAMNWINSVPQTAATTFAFCLYPSSMGLLLQKNNSGSLLFQRFF